MSQAQAQKKLSSKKKRHQETSPTPKESKGAEIRDELDGIIGEIDGLLTENAKEFVESYVQKSGQ